jgi:hypothetical protein
MYLSEILKIYFSPLRSLLANYFSIVLMNLQRISVHLTETALCEKTRHVLVLIRVIMKENIDYSALQ